MTRPPRKNPRAPRKIKRMPWWKQFENQRPIVYTFGDASVTWTYDIDKDYGVVVTVRYRTGDRALDANAVYKDPTTLVAQAPFNSAAELSASWLIKHPHSGYVPIAALIEDIHATMEAYAPEVPDFGANPDIWLREQLRRMKKSIGWKREKGRREDWQAEYPEMLPVAPFNVDIVEYVQALDGALTAHRKLDYSDSHLTDAAADAMSIIGYDTPLDLSYELVSLWIAAQFSGMVDPRLPKWYMRLYRKEERKAMKAARS